MISLRGGEGLQFHTTPGHLKHITNSLAKRIYNAPTPEKQKIMYDIGQVNNSNGLITTVSSWLDDFRIIANQIVDFEVILNHFTEISKSLIYQKNGKIKLVTDNFNFNVDKKTDSFSFINFINLVDNKTNLHKINADQFNMLQPIVEVNQLFNKRKHLKV